jgi:cytochrome c biogenesis protein CcmG, thiol:disulfide interchange protein DsbE
MNRALTLFPIVALALLVAIAAFMLTRGGERETFSGGLIGRPAPSYSLTPLGEGPPVTRDDFAGRAYLINVFASWCAPCRVEHPQLIALSAGGVPILGVAYKDGPEATAAFLEELGNPYSAVALDPDGRFGLDLGLIGAPETFVIGSDGAVRAVHRGVLTPEVIEETIMPALAEEGRL